MMREGLLSIEFAAPVNTAEDMARRYRVLAALHPQGVRFNMTPDELRALAQFCDQVIRVQRRPPAVLVVERDALMSWPMQLLIGIGTAVLVLAAAVDLAGLLRVSAFGGAG